VVQILVLSPYEPPADGIAKHTARLVEAWDAAGHDVLVIAPGTRGSSKETEDVGSRSNVVRILHQFPKRSVLNTAEDFRPDVVFVQFAISTLNVNLWSVMNLCKQFAAARVPVVVAYHEPTREYDLLRFVSRQIYRRVARLTDVPIVFSSTGRQALIESGLFKEAVQVHLGTIGVAKISVDDIERVKSIYKIRKPLVLSLGFTSADKGTDVLLEAAGEIATSRDGDVQFLIAGSPRRRRGAFRLMERRDVNYQRRLEGQAKTIATAEIAFGSYVDERDVPSLLFVAAVVALPYRRITQSAMANLALSSRSVIVCSDIPGLRSDLGDAARYVVAGDSHALAEEIVRVLGDHRESVRMRDLSGKRAASNTYAIAAEEILSAGLAHRATDFLG